MKKHIFSLGATALVSMGIAGMASADAETYKVQSGDTLYSISKKYNVSVKDLQAWNNLSSTIIYANQTLHISSSSDTNTASPSPSTSQNTYKVQSGDTLYHIAKSHGLSVEQLKQYNNLSSNVIYVNQVLTVNGSSAVTAPADEKIEQPAPVSTYKVKPGDTLWSIAQRHGISVSRLQELNGLSANTIYINQVLKVNGSVAPAPAAPEVSNPVSSKPQTPAPSENQEVKKEFQVVATAYTAFCTGCSGITKTGIDLRANPNQKVIAVDPSVIPLGSRVYVEGYGEAIAGDTGGAIKGNRIDVFIPSQSEAMKWGRKTVTVKILN
ncbi:LysM peptidoglycan-binding and 3D domain-containing protein [Priestia flexa]|uniref:LysM peptidoglycan-binding and 3D domain-containing protein n=1 Tax=Priestia flexa TaxID=86664 RepID=UPI001B33EE33|nr:LysM peptidoglycan-binding and 3D domain-containing protein [Priestia flexa]